MSRTPRLSIGLPVYNGERFLVRSIESLLGQSFGDFELIISDNASTDGTSDICKQYEQEDSRIRYFRQPSNIGLAPNHNFTVHQAAGELFKWVAYDDLYAKGLLQQCVAILDKFPDVVLAHSWTAIIDTSDNVIGTVQYGLKTSSPSVSERFRSLLFDAGGDDDYGVTRTSMLRRIAPKNSYHHADRVIVAELALHGRFYQVPDWLFFRRVHTAQAGSGTVTMRRRCVTTDPRRANRLLHPSARLYGEYVWGYVNAVRCAPLSRAERGSCYRLFAEYLANRTAGRASVNHDQEMPPTFRPDIRIGSLVAGLGNAHDA